MDGFFPDVVVSHWVDRIGFVLTTWLVVSLALSVPYGLPPRLAILILFISGHFYTLFWSVSL